MVSADKRLWEELEVDYTKFTKGWEKRYKKNLRRVLKCQLDTEDIDEVADSLGLTLTGSSKIEKIDEILKPDVAPTIWMLYDFQKTKIKVIEEYCSSNTLKTKLPEITSKNTSMGQISLIYSKQRESLRDVYTLSHRRSLKSGWEHESVIPITQAHIDRILKKETKLLRFMNKRDRDNFKWKFYRKTIIDGSVLLMFLRQVKDKVERDIDRPRRIKTTIKCFIEFHIERKDIQIICSRYRDWRSLEKGVEEILFPIPKKDDSFRDFDDRLYEEFTERICSTESQRDMKIVEITFPRSELPSSPRLHLADKTRKQGLAEAINTLVDEGKIKIKSLYDIDSLRLRFRKRTKAVEREYVGPGLVELGLDDRGLDDEEIQSFRDEFKRVFGFPLSKPIKHPHKKEDLERLLSDVFSKKQLFNPGKYERDIISKLKTLKLITTKEQDFCFCTANPSHKDVYSDPKTEKCNICHSKIVPARKVININFSESKILSFIKNILTREGIHVEEPVYKHKGEVKLISTTYLNKPCYVYVNYKPLPRKILDLFRASDMPLIVVNIGSARLSQKIQEYNMLKPVDFNEIIISTLENNLARDYFSKLIEERIDLFYSNIITASNVSYNRLKNFLSSHIAYEDGDFEVDVFNLLRRIFPNSQRWGNLYSNKPLPDGVGGISISGVPKGCFTWDCKLAEVFENGSFSPHILSRGEKRAGRSYIKRLCENKEIVQYGSGKKLDSFIIVSNKINPTNFNNYAEHLKRTEYYLRSKKRWKGEVIFLSSEALLHLYRKYENESAKPEFNQDIFNKKVSPLFLNKKRHPKGTYYKEVSIEDIDKIVDDYTSMLPKAPIINPDNIAEE